MNNPYTPPSADLEVEPDDNYINNSGGGSGTIPPPEVIGWSWGAFLFGWIWAIGNKTWIGLLCMIPYLGWLCRIYLGIKGRELAWQNKRWKSVAEFNRVQRKWSVWAGILIGGAAGIGILAAIAIPAYQQYVQQAIR